MQSDTKFMGQSILGTVTQTVTLVQFEYIGTFLTYESRIQPLIIFMRFLPWSHAPASVQTLYGSAKG